MIVLGHLTEAQRRDYWIELRTRDEALLSAELNDCLAEDFDLSLVGFSDGGLGKLLAFVPEGDGIRAKSLRAWVRSMDFGYQVVCLRSHGDKH